MPKRKKFKEYEEFVLGLMSEASMKSLESRMATAGLGLAGESGEVSDILKKVLFHGKEMNKEVRGKLMNELGDILFYLTFAAKSLCGVSIKEIMQMNVDKLSERYKTGKFTEAEFQAKELGKNV